MGSEWKKCLLGDVIELKRGYDLPKKKRVRGPHAIISSSGTSDFHSEYKVKAPGVVTGRYGTIGEVFYTEEDFWPLNTTLYVRDFKGHDPLYIYYFLKTIPYHLFSDKAAVPGVNRNHLHMAEVEIPGSIDDEKEIGRVLSSIDKKIQLNHQTNQTLEKIAQALFKSWFVDFDPVIDNALEVGNSIPPALEKRAKKRAEQIVQLRAQAQATAEKTSANGANTSDDNENQPAFLNPEIRKLFPSEFEETEELGWVPKGWVVDELRSFIDTLETGRRPKGGVSKYKTGIPSVGAESINGIGDFDFSKTKFVPEEFFEKMKSGKVQDYDVLLYKDGGKPGDFKPRIGMFGEGFPFDEYGINEHVFRVRSKSLGQFFLYYQLGSQRVFHDLSVRGGKAAIPGVNQEEVKSQVFLVPPENILNEFNALVSDNVKSMLKNSAASLVLARLRDALLPKLISGELRLSSTATTDTPTSDARVSP